MKVLFCCFALRGKKSEEVPKPFKCSALEDIWPPAQPRTERIPSPKPWGDSAAVRSHLESASLKIDRPNAGVDGEALPLSGDPPPRNTARWRDRQQGKHCPAARNPCASTGGETKAHPPGSETSQAFSPREPSFSRETPSTLGRVGNCSRSSLQLLRLFPPSLLLGLDPRAVIHCSLCKWSSVEQTATVIGHI